MRYDFFITSVQVRKLRGQTIYSGPHNKDVLELNQVPLTPDTKLSQKTLTVSKSSTQQKQLMGCMNGVTGFWPF